MTPLLERVRSRVAADFAQADVAHNIGHLERVAALAEVIATATGADPEIAQVAAYVHDYHRLEEARQGHRPILAGQCATVVSDTLMACQVPRTWHPVILGAVEATGRYRFAGDAPPEPDAVVAAVHDADNLDAMGAIGVGRAFAFGGLLGEPLWDTRAELMERYQEGTTSSVLAHLYEKLVCLENDMLTEPGKAMAAERALVLHRFAADFRAEWTGRRAAPWWDPRTRHLAVDFSPESGEPTVHIGFRGPVVLAFDESGQPLAVDLLEVPDALACSVSRAPAWALDTETRGIWIELADGSVHHRLVGTGDIEVRLAKGQPATLRLHLVDYAVAGARTTAWVR